MRQRFVGLFACVFAFAFVFVAAGCDSTSGQTTLLKRPDAPASAIAIEYVPAPMRADGATAPQEGLDAALLRAGYISLGGRISRLAPELLSPKGVSVQMRPVTRRPDGQFVAMASTSAETAFVQKELVIFVTDVSVNKQGRNATLTLQTVFRDTHPRTVYWRAAYTSVAVAQSVDSMALDDEAVSKLLQQIFSDLEKEGLIV